MVFNRAGSVFCLSLLVLFAVTLLRSPVPAAADLTISTRSIVAGINTTDQQPVQQVPYTFTNYFSNGRWRMECSDGSVYIFDCPAGFVYELNTKQQTYRSSTIKDLEDFRSLLPKRMAHDVSLDSDLSVGQSILTATYLSCQTVDVPLAGYARISRSESGAFPGGGAGRHRGGGGDSGGAGGGLPYAPDGNGVPGHGGGFGRFPSYQLQGDLWTSSQYEFPKQKHFSCLPIALELLWGCPPMIGEMSDTLAQIRQIPLHSVINIGQTFAGGRDGANSSTPSTTVTTTFDVTSISTTAVNPPLFTVPAGYSLDSSSVSFPQLAQSPNSPAQSGDEPDGN